MFPEVTTADRLWLREAWLQAQDHRCAVCDHPATATQRPSRASWFLDFHTTHGKPYCWNCVAGVVCWGCMVHMKHFRAHDGNLPRQDVNGMDPYEWAERARGHLDLGVCVGASDSEGAEL